MSKSQLTATFSALAFCLVSFASGEGANGFAHGVVKVSGFEPGAIIEFYRRPNETAPIKQLRVMNSPISGWLELDPKEEDEKWFRPEMIFADEGLSAVALRCLQANNGWYQVIVNEEDGQTLWIKRSVNVKQIQWKEYFQSMCGLRRNDRWQNEIHVRPTEESSTIDYKGDDCFQVERIQGEWALVVQSEHCGSDEGPKLSSKGWIKWTDGSHLLVNYFYLEC